MTMTRDTKIYGLIGYPLGHSFSIDYFNNKFASEGVDAVYMNFEIEDVRQLMDLIAEYPQLCGLNVTAPYKEKVIPLLDELDDGARAIGAVNVIKFVRGASGNLLLRGYNSDALGFGRTVESLLTTDRDRALVLGTGGAAKAVKYALAAQECPHDSLPGADTFDCRRASDHCPGNAVGQVPTGGRVPRFPFPFPD